MSPERLNPNQFGLKDSRPTKESDCYALGMVILEVLSGQVPFRGDCNDFIVMQKVLDGEHPGRPRGAKEAWFTGDLWGMLEQCWSWQRKDRPTVEDVHEHLERVWTTWQPLPLGADSDVDTDTDDESWLTANGPGISPHYVLTSPRLLILSLTAGSSTRGSFDMNTAESLDGAGVPSPSQVAVSRLLSEKSDLKESAKIISRVSWNVLISSGINRISYQAPPNHLGELCFHASNPLPTRSPLRELVGGDCTEPNVPNLGGGGRGAPLELTTRLSIDSTAGCKNGPATDNIDSKSHVAVVNGPPVRPMFLPSTSSKLSSTQPVGRRV